MIRGIDMMSVAAALGAACMLLAIILGVLVRDMLRRRASRRARPVVITVNGYVATPEQLAAFGEEMRGEGGGGGAAIAGRR